MLQVGVSEKIEKKLSLINKWRYAKILDVNLEAAVTEEHFRTPPEHLKYAPAPIGSRWGEHWKTVWFRGEIKIPKQYRNYKIFYRHDSVAEKLLFVNGVPYAGMDLNHKEVLLTPRAKGGESYDIYIESYCGHPFPGVEGYDLRIRTLHSVGDSPEEDPPLLLRASELLYERVYVNNFYFDALVLFQISKILDDNSLRKAKILKELNKALDLIPVHWDNEEELYECFKNAHKIIKPLLNCENSPSTPFIGLVGHAHIDIGWLWPVRETVRKSARTFSSMLLLMGMYPEFRFIQSQPVLYKMIEDNYPELLVKIKKRVREGRWEPNGGMWVEADCNITGGESLVRQIMEGMKAVKAYFGYTPDTLWLPDVFGYSAALPQILRKFNIEHFVTSKINWNDTNRFPYDTFWWQGIDGSKIFTHFLTTRTNGYNAYPSPIVLKETWDYVQHKDIQSSVLCSIGYGDGGGGANREMIEVALRLKNLEGCPKAEFVNVSEFLSNLKKETGNELPTWVGELYLELHRGTYTTQANTKKYMRKLELMFREAELWCSVAMVYGYEYPKDKFEVLWRKLLTNQFHDILPGTSINKVYEDAEKDFKEILTELQDLKEKVVKFIGEKLSSGSGENCFLVTNSLSWTRSDLVFLPKVDFNDATDVNGNSFETQVTKDGLYVYLTLPSMSIMSVTLRNREKISPSPFVHVKSKLESPFYSVRFDNAGRIESLWDKDANREVVAEGGKINFIYTAEDIPVVWDAWDINQDYRDKITEEKSLISSEVVEDGPLFHVVRNEYKIGKSSRMVQDVVFYSKNRRIDFNTTVDWKEKHTLLKAGFNFNVFAEEFKNDIQFGYIVRPMHQNTSWDRAKFEVCAHKWVDVSETNYGVAILNDCKYGHDAFNGRVSITLLRSPMAPDLEADQGVHHFTYSILPHLGDFSVEKVVRSAYELNIPLESYQITNAQSNMVEMITFCLLDNPNVVVETVKKAEEDDALILRLYEAGKSRGKVRIGFPFKVRKVYECNLKEDNLLTLEVLGGNTIEFCILPFEIKTIKVYYRK
ncbi:MAG: glycosyl hydrolase-related protein [Candidatus Hydrogenedentes bacterium]|nr:glycosyl hydrolase-related protein [Candidatus Hydrogenedentota bacterium]